MPFNPAIEREAFLHADRALLRQLLDIDFEPWRPMGYLAVTTLHKLVYCWLVGLHEEIAPVLPRVIAWLDHAIEAGGAERDEGAGARPADLPAPGSSLHAARAMARWFRSGDDAQDDWDAARRSQAAWHACLVRGDRRTSPNPLALDDYLAWCVLSGAHAAGIELIESQLALRASAQAHAMLRRLPRPREFAYAICLGHARGRFEPTELFEAGLRMLGSCVNETWLATGESLRAAMWLKIVHRDLALQAGRPAEEPLAVVRRALDHLAPPALRGHTTAPPRNRPPATTPRASESHR